MTKEEFLSGARFYNAVRGKVSDWVFVKAGRVYHRKFVESMPTGTTSPIVIEHISNDGFIECSNMFWDRNQFLNLEELELVPSEVEQNLFASKKKAS